MNATNKNLRSKKENEKADKNRQSVRFASEEEKISSAKYDEEENQPLNGSRPAVRQRQPEEDESEEQKTFMVIVIAGGILTAFLILLLIFLIAK